MSRQIVFLTLSGVGNSTAKKALVATSAYANGVTCTTRPRRPNEVDGVDYDFLTPEQFRIAEWNEEVAEKTNYRGNGTAYGILQNRIDEARSSPVPTIWILNQEGLRWMQEAFLGEVTAVFLWADKETCRWRLTQRGDSPEEIEGRQAGYETDLAEGMEAADFIIDTTYAFPDHVVETLLEIL